jgi:hypothetical protein
MDWTLKAFSRFNEEDGAWPGINGLTYTIDSGS